MIVFHRHVLLLTVFLVLISSSTVTVHAQSTLGLLRIASFQYPKQVVPSSNFSVSIDLEYAVHGNMQFNATENATIRAAIFSGNNSVWQSDQVVVSGGGDKVWTVNVTAPSTEGTLQLTAYAFYLNNGEWKYYNDTLQGPGYAVAIIRVSSTANLTIELGIPKLEVAIGNLTEATSSNGSAEATLRVGKTYAVSVPLTTEFNNGTRVVFNGWSDGNNQTNFNVTFDGDAILNGSYRMQYLLTVNSIVTTYSFTRWTNAGSNVTLQAETSVPSDGILGVLELKNTFLGWSGDVNSNSSEITFVMNSPKTINANYSTDYEPLVFPSILLAGIIGAIILTLLRRRNAQAQPEAKLDENNVEGAAEAMLCSKCGEAVEKEWTHCIRCGADLTGTRPVNQ